MAGIFHLTHLEAKRRGAGPGWGKCAAHAKATTLTCRQESSGRGRGRRPGSADVLTWRRGGRAADSAGEGAARCEVGPQVRAVGRAALHRGGRFLAGKRCNCEQLFLVCQAGRAAASPGGAASRGPGRGKAARRPEAGRMRTGCGRGGASPLGGAAVRRAVRERVRGPGHGLLADGGIPWARLSDHKGRCGREPPGAAGGRVGRTEAAAGRPGVGGGGARGRGIPGGRRPRSHF